jgi:hypothetical protein
MLRAGTISKDMHDAARDFQAQFTSACYDVVRCMPLMRLPGGGGHGDLTDAQVDARRRVGSALDALAVLAVLPAAASGTSWGCSARSASGRYGRAGADGRYGLSRRRGSWWRRWGCWRGGMGMKLMLPQD